MINLAASVLPAPDSPLKVPAVRYTKKSVRQENQQPDDDTLVLLVAAHSAVCLLGERVDMRRQLMTVLALQVKHEEDCCVCR
jgi:hypothetical protein